MGLRPPHPSPAAAAMASVCRSQASCYRALTGLCARGLGGHPRVCARHGQPCSQAGSGSGTHRVLDALSSTQLTVTEVLSMVVSIILYWFVLSLIHSTNTYYFIIRHLLNPGDTGPSSGRAHSLAEKSHSQIINSPQECKVGLLSKSQINRIKDKSHMIILIDAEKNPIPFQNKNIQQTRNKREPPQSDKGSTKKTCSKRLYIFLSKIKNKTKMSNLATST